MSPLIERMVQRKTGWLNIVQTEDAARNPVELFDFIDRTKYLATGHRFDVINGAL